MDNSYCISFVDSTKPKYHLTLLWLGNKLENLSEAYNICSKHKPKSFSIVFDKDILVGPEEKPIAAVGSSCPLELDVRDLRAKLEHLNDSRFKEWLPHISGGYTGLTLNFDCIDITCTSPDFNLLKRINLD